MSAAACARTASDLTALVTRLGRTRRALLRQSRLAEEDFGGLSGDAYRRHAARSAVIVAGACSDLALLAGALATLGRELAAAEEIRTTGHSVRADEAEGRAQDRWRAAVASYEGRSSPPRPPARQPVVPDVAPGPATAAASPVPVAASPAPPQLESCFVTPSLELESELVTPEVVDGHR